MKEKEKEKTPSGGIKIMIFVSENKTYKIPTIISILYRWDVYFQLLSDGCIYFSLIRCISYI